MIDKPPDDRDASRSPHWIWGALIAAWAALVYILFFINLVRDFLASRGGG